MTNPQSKALARRLSVLERDRIQRKQANLGYSTIDGGAIQAQDSDDNLTMVIGQQFDGTNTASVITGPIPPQPIQPMLTPGPGTLRIYWDGTFTADDVAPMDFARVTIHAVPQDDYVSYEPLNQAYIVGSISSATGGEVTAALSLESHVVYLVAWSQAGKFSTPSAVEISTPDALPTPVEAPSASPDIRAVGLPSSILLVSAPIAGTDHLTYQFSYDGSSWVDLPDMPTKQNSWTVDATPDGPFELETSYHFRAIAGNVVGDAAPGSPDEAELDTAAMELIASRVITAELITEAIQAGVVRVGSNITISADGGIEILQSDGGFTRFPADGSAAQITGDFTAQGLTIEDGASIYGESDVSGTIQLNADVKDPDKAPDVGAFYHTLDFGGAYGSAVSVSGLCRNLADDGWVTILARPDLGANVYHFLQVSDTNVATTSPLPTITGLNAVGGIVTHGGAYYFMYRKNTADWYVGKVAALGTTMAAGYPQFYGTSRPLRPGLGSDGTWLYIATLDSSIADLRIDLIDAGLFNVAGTMFAASGVTVNTSIRGLYYGPGDYGSDRLVVNYSTGVRVYNTTPSGGYDCTYVAADGWARPYNVEVGGLHWDGTNFWSIDVYGGCSRLEPKATLTDSWWAYAWVDSDTHTTLPSPRKQWTPPSRALVGVIASTPPQVADAGTHVANKVQVFAASSAVATLYEQGGALPVGTISWPYTPVRETVTAAPGTNNWSSVAVSGKLFSDAEDANGAIINLEGGGPGRVGDLTWAADGKTGWLGAPIALTIGAGDVVASTGWTVQSGEYVQFGPLIALNLEVTRTGADMGPMSSGGNLSPDISVCTGIPAAIRPSTQNAQGIIKRGAVQTGFCELTPAGGISFTDGLPSATYAGSSTAYKIRMVYCLGM